MTKSRQYILGALTIAISLLSYVFFTLPDGLLHIHFLNIGQGDSILIRSPSGHNILVDGGPGTKVIEELSEVLPFYERTIDLLILTHPDQDHIEGTIEVLKSYQVQKVLFTGINSKSPFYQAFLNQIKQKHIPIEFAQSQSDFSIDNLNFDLIYPFVPITGTTPLEPNNTSVVFKLIYQDHSILFTGDIEAEVESAILASHQNLHSSILKVPHHGSQTSSTKDFIKAVSPQYAVIQVAPNNRHHHPHSQSLDTLQNSGISKIYRNDLNGRIEVISDGSQLEIKKET